MDDGGAGLIVLLLADPHLLEGGQRGQDGASDPHRVLALRRSSDLYLHRAGSQGGNLLLHPVGDARVHGGAARQHCVGIQVFVDVHIRLHDGVEGSFVDATGFHAHEGSLEECLGAAEPLVANGDDLAIGQLVALLQGGAGAHHGRLLLKVQGDAAQLFLDVTHNFLHDCGGEAVATLGEDLHEVVSQVPASQVHRMVWGRGVPFIDGHSVGDPITGVHHNASYGQRRTGTARPGWPRIRLGCEGLKHDLSHLLAVVLGVQRGLSQQHSVLLKSHTWLVVEGVVSDLLHVIPVGDDAMLNGVLQGQDASLALGLIHIGVLLTHAHHHALVP